MLSRPGDPVPIDPSQVVVGLYVWLDIPWADHPFVTSRVMVKSMNDVALIKASDAVGKLYYYPDKSTVAPPPPIARKSMDEDAGARAEAKTGLAQQVLEVMLAKRERLQKQNNSASRADQAWEQAARATRDALLNLTRTPKAAGEQLADLSRQTASTIANGQDILLHLLGDKQGKGPQFHALNTMTLCMLVGKYAGLTERELADLALGALAHDAGKAQIPPQILQTANRRKFEEDFFRQHVKFSVQFAEQSGAFSREALAVIAGHHEAVDGSGWPTGRKEGGQGARILAVVDRFDRLCTPEATDRDAMMPSEALAHMFRNEKSRFDLSLLSTLIKLLGVYPPGTVVHLSDGSLALVVAPGPTSLQPKVMLYSPQVAKGDAPTLDLSEEPELKITEAVRPAALPVEVLEWINPQKRLSYYFTVTERRS